MSIPLLKPLEMPMAANSIPDGYHTIASYLTVEGVDKLIRFLRKAFDAQEKEASRDRTEASAMQS